MEIVREKICPKLQLRSHLIAIDICKSAAVRVAKAMANATVQLCFILNGHHRNENQITEEGAATYHRLMIVSTLQRNIYFQKDCDHFQPRMKKVTKSLQDNHSSSFRNQTFLVRVPFERLTTIGENLSGLIWTCKMQPSADAKCKVIQRGCSGLPAIFGEWADCSSFNMPLKSCLLVTKAPEVERQLSSTEP